MKITLYFEKENLGRLAIAMIFAGVLCIKIGFSPWALLGFGACYFACKSLKIELNEKLSSMWAALMLGGGSVFTAHLVQYLLLSEELRAKTSDTKMWLNVLCCLIIFLVAQTFANNVGNACIIAHICLMLLAGVNYFVYLFRGNEFIFSDLKSIQTGLSVAGNYEFSLEHRVGYTILICALYVALMRKLHVSFQKRIPMRAICISLAIFCSVYIAKETEYYTTETWEQKGSYRNGYILNFVLSARDSFVSEPEGYSQEAIAKLEDTYVGDGAAYTEENAEKPTIIVIMNESYADLSVIGDFNTNIEVAPFYDSLTDNIIKGYAISSVFGAKTPNSEWEFMTGNSMAFLPSGSVVYQQYISEAPTSIVSDLKSIGYTCVAMHPYYETGWSRNVIYPKLGFDESYFLEEFDRTKLLRSYITDQELYEHIIKRYESRGVNEDLFIMSISMQNHGGYTEKYDNFTEEVRMLGLDYPDVNQYLSLVHESDKALEYLISYFQEVEEPVEIVFFGDHQPSLSASFYPYLNGKGLSGLTKDELEELYMVPFFIWTNYASESKEVEITSLNFLATLALKRAGIALPPYHQFLSDLMEVLPAVNSRGYYSKTKGEFLDLESAAGEEAVWLQKYEMLQYNNMFDARGRSKQFFP
ncbi:MAG: LTA synthase family protein [Clostridiales bacterium]|nr:LTA synthase family protein [Clostridiales bacterium]